MRGAAFVHEDLDGGIPSHECSCRTGMIDVNVRQQYHRDVVQFQTLRLQAELQRFNRRRGAGVDQRDESRCGDNRGGDGFRLAEKIEIDVRKARRQSDRRRCHV